MRIQEIPLKIGDTLTLKQPLNSYFLPYGLFDGDTVQLVRKERRVLIVEKDGKQWRIDEICVRHKYLCQVGTLWLPEDHPDVFAQLQIEQRRAKWIRDNPRKLVA